MEDFEAQVKMVLHEIETDVVFSVNFKNCPMLAIEDVLGIIPDDRLAYEIVEAVRARLRQSLRRSEHHHEQIMAFQRELEAPHV